MIFKKSGKLMIKILTHKIVFEDGDYLKIGYKGEVKEEPKIDQKYIEKVKKTFKKDIDSVFKYDESDILTHLPEFSTIHNLNDIFIEGEDITIKFKDIKKIYNVSNFMDIFNITLLDIKKMFNKFDKGFVSDICDYCQDPYTDSDYKNEQQYFYAEKRIHFDKDSKYSNNNNYGLKIENTAYIDGLNEFNYFNDILNISDGFNISLITCSECKSTEINFEEGAI